MDLGVGLDRDGDIHVLSPSMLQNAMQADDHVVVIAVNDPSLEAHLNQGDYYSALSELYLRLKPRRRASVALVPPESPKLSPRRGSLSGSSSSTPRLRSLSSPGFFKRKKKASSSALVDAEAERHGGIAKLVELQESFVSTEHHVVKVYHADSQNAKLMAICKNTRAIDVVLYLSTLWALKSKRRHLFRLVVAKVEDNVSREYELDDIDSVWPHCQGLYRLFLAEVSRTLSIASSAGSQELEVAALRRTGSNSSLSSAHSEDNSRSNSPARSPMPKSPRRKAHRELPATPPSARRGANSRNYIHLSLMNDSAQKELQEAKVTNVLLNAEPGVVAHELAVSNFELFAAVHPLEYLAALWPKLSLDCSNLDALTDRFNWIVRWAKTAILIHKQDVKRRTESIKRLVAVATASVKINDLLAAFGIISGLACSEVSRLKKTWSAVKNTVKQEYDELEALMNPTRNMAAYRTLFAQASQNPPAVPFLPLIMKDLAFIHEGNETHIDNLVNYDKLRMLARELRNITTLVRHSKRNFEAWAKAPFAGLTLKAAYAQQEMHRATREAIFNSEVIDDEERFLGLSFFCEQSRHLLRHLKISEPIPQRLGTGADQDLLDVQDALALFGPKPAAGVSSTDPASEEKTPKTSTSDREDSRPSQVSSQANTPSPTPAIASLTDSPTPELRERLDSSSSDHSLYGEDLVHYANLRRLPGRSSGDAAGQSSRFVQADSVGSVDGGLEYPNDVTSNTPSPPYDPESEAEVHQEPAEAKHSEPDVAILVSSPHRSSLSERRAPTSPLASISQTARNLSPAPYGSLPTSPRSLSSPVIVNPSPLAIGTMARRQLSLGELARQEHVDSSSEDLPSQASDSARASESESPARSPHTNIRTLQSPARRSSSARDSRSSLSSVEDADNEAASDLHPESTSSPASNNDVFSSSSSKSSLAEAMSSAPSEPESAEPSAERPTELSRQASTGSQSSVKTVVPAPEAPKPDYDMNSENDDHRHTPTLPSKAGPLRVSESPPDRAADIDAWIASMAIPAYEPVIENEDIEHLLATLHVPAPDMDDLPPRSDESSPEVLLTPPPIRLSPDPADTEQAAGMESHDNKEEPDSIDEPTRVQSAHVNLTDRPADDATTAAVNDSTHEREFGASGNDKDVPASTATAAAEPKMQSEVHFSTASPTVQHHSDDARTQAAVVEPSIPDASIAMKKTIDSSALDTHQEAADVALNKSDPNTSQATASEALLPPGPPSSMFSDADEALFVVPPPPGDQSSGATGTDVDIDALLASMAAPEMDLPES
eukprot:TRINITY_DN11239_c0_g1_i1.p1 TRINITY_DN11239_c0_g1~~TRINITY_DN11239_c0_g1_i1.p1  ORF type:complete len:1334 (+),score=252.47 TRINITY_DN11239_c0_g1_i1:133-4002(+)